MTAPTPPNPPKKPKPDWEKAKALYRANAGSVREIARQCGCSHVGLMRKAAKEGWEHDLADRVKAAVKERLVKEDAVTTLAASVTTGNAGDASLVTDEQTVEAAAAAAVSVVRGHRRDLTQYSDTCRLLFEQLKGAAGSRDELDKTAVEVAYADGPLGAAQRLSNFRKAISLPTHAGTIRDLSTAAKNFQALERTAWNLNEKADIKDNDLVGALKELNGGEVT